MEALDYRQRGKVMAATLELLDEIHEHAAVHAASFEGSITDQVIENYYDELVTNSNGVSEFVESIHTLYVQTFQEMRHIYSEIGEESEYDSDDFEDEHYSN